VGPILAPKAIPIKHFTGFGMTEMSVATHLPMPSEAGSKHDSVGKLAPNLEMKVNTRHFKIMVEKLIKVGGHFNWGGSGAGNAGGGAFSRPN
jgi:long-subunit acyl-CoA synthetase (AMP-forming)